MRTTVTLDPDVEALLQKYMRERGLSFKEAVNQALTLGLGSPHAEPREATPTYRLGLDPRFNWDKALDIAAELEDQHILGVMAKRERLGESRR